jgi:hypothetical protein
MTTLTHSHSHSPSPGPPNHNHRHSPSHSHGAAGAAAELLPDSSPVAAVVLDIGDGFGAVVIDTPPWLEGHEIEIRKVGAEWRGVHTAVRARLIPTGTQYAAVFGSLAEGRYDLRVRGDLDESAVLSLDVTSASVTYSLWP